MKKIIDSASTLTATVVKVLVVVAVCVVTIDNFFVTIVLMLALPLLIGTFSAGMAYVNSTGSEVKRISNDRKITKSAVTSKGFNVQKYIADHLIIYGVCNKGTSLNEREIHRYEYSRMGL